MEFDNDDDDAKVVIITITMTIIIMIIGGTWVATRLGLTAALAVVAAVTLELLRSASSSSLLAR